MIGVAGSGRGGREYHRRGYSGFGSSKQCQEIERPGKIAEPANSRIKYIHCIIVAQD